MKAKIGVLLFLLLSLATAWAAAETARDITSNAAVRITNANGTKQRMLDRNKLTALQADSRVNPYIEVTMQEEPCAAVYVEFGENVLPFSVEVQQGKKWVEIARQDTPYAQSYLSFEPSAQFRLVFHTDGKKKALYIRELYLFSEGDMDESIVHIWQPPEEKADLLVLAAHPDDEVLWLGGVLPYYAGEKQLRVQVVMLTCGNSGRRLELLDSIWHCGVRHYPEIGAFKDVKSYSIRDLYQQWNKSKVESFLTSALRRYQPEVVVTHAFDGESGHAAHKICARSMQACVTLAADPSYTLRGETYQPWQVKKFYAHKGDGDLTAMDWDQPLPFFAGKTAYEVAQEAYGFHKSQPQPKKGDAAESALYYVAGRNDPNSSYVFSLVYSAVGEDEEKNDLLEHLPADLFDAAR